PGANVRLVVALQPVVTSSPVSVRVATLPQVQGLVAWAVAVAFISCPFVGAGGVSPNLVIRFYHVTCGLRKYPMQCDLRHTEGRGPEPPPGSASADDRELLRHQLPTLAVGVGEDPAVGGHGALVHPPTDLTAHGAGGDDLRGLPGLRDPGDALADHVAETEPVGDLRGELLGALRGGDQVTGLARPDQEPLQPRVVTRGEGPAGGRRAAGPGGGTVGSNSGEEGAGAGGEGGGHDRVLSAGPGAFPPTSEKIIS